MKKSLFAALTLLSFFSKANVFNSKGESLDIPYTPWLPYDNYYNIFPQDTTKLDGPLTITEKGVYYLNNQGSASQRAVDVWGSTGTITIAGGYVKAVDGNNGIHINEYIYAFINKVKVVHFSTGANVQPGKAIYGFRPRTFIADHCDISGQSGIIVQESDKFNLRDSVVVRYCTFTNITKVKPNGEAGSEHCHSIHFDGLQNYKKLSMYGNRSVGTAGDANEDIINISNSWGVDGSTIDVWGNLMSSSLKYHIDSPEGFSGSVFTIEGNTHGVRCLKNIFLDGENALANISEPGPGSYDNIISDNYMVSCGRPRGARTLTPWQYWAGLSIYQNAGAPDSGRNNFIVRNWIAFVSNRKLSHYYPPSFPDREDENNVNAVSKPVGTRIPTQNRMPPGYNYYLPYMPTPATEDSAIKRWDDSLARAGGYVGVIATAPTTTTTTNIFSADTAFRISADSLSLVVSDSTGGNINPVNRLGNTAAYKTGSVSYTTLGTACSISKDPFNETRFIIKAFSAGKATGTATLQTVSGKVISKSFSVEVKDLEPVDIRINFR